MMNIPAVFILLILTLLLIRGTRESALVNGVIVILKVSIVLLFIGIGWHFINPANHTLMIPAATTYTTPQGITHNYGGILGILGAAGVENITIEGNGTIDGNGLKFWTGQGDNTAFIGSSACSLLHRLDQRQSWARRTSPAVSGLRST